MKECTKCGVEKPLTRFSPHPFGKGRTVSWCKDCKNEYARAYRAAGREKTAKTRRATNAYAVQGVERHTRHYALEPGPRTL